MKKYKGTKRAALEIGKVYVNRFGKKVKIISYEEDSTSSFIGDDGLKYGLVGVCMGKGASWDLVDFFDDDEGCKR